MGNNFIVNIIWLLIAIFLSIFGLWVLYIGITEKNIVFGLIGGGVILGEILFFRMSVR